MRISSLFATLFQAGSLAQASASEPSSHVAAKSPFPRNFRKHPVVLRLSEQEAPSRLAAMGDNHAAFNQTVRVLLGNDIVSLCPEGPKRDRHCGKLPQADWGDFRWDNPYCWKAGDLGLVKTGDDFDKGAFNLVTACFWLDMVEQAKAAGGFVWPLWGNHEAAIMAKASNDKSMGPGGLNFELLHYGIDTERFTSNAHAFGRTLRQRAALARIGPFFFSHAGNTQFHSLDSLEKKIVAGLSKDGADTPILTDEDGLLRSRSPGGPAGVRGPELASCLDRHVGSPIRTIVFGHDPERSPRGLITAYSLNSHNEPSLIDIDVGLSPVIGYSGFNGGSLLRIDRTADGYNLTAADRKGRRRPLGSVASGPRANGTSPDAAAKRPAMAVDGSRATAATDGHTGGRSSLARRTFMQVLLPLASFLQQDHGNRWWSPRPEAVPPGRRRPHGLHRNFTEFPAIVSLDGGERATGRVVVIGSSYGDLRRTKELLRGARLIGPAAHVDAHIRTVLGEALYESLHTNRHRPVTEPVRWIGGNATLVQIGNQFGFGYGNLESIDLFQQLDTQARAVGGRAISLLGAREVDLLVSPENDDTWGPGGIGTQWTGLDRSPTEMVARGTHLYRWLSNRPFGVHVHGSLILSAGQTSNRRWQDMGADLEEALRWDGFAASLVSGDNSCTKSIGFAGRDGHQGPLLAATGGVHNIIHGYDESMQPEGLIKAYGHKANGQPSLINVETGFNAAKNASEGQYLTIESRGKNIHYHACSVWSVCAEVARERRRKLHL